METVFHDVPFTPGLKTLSKKTHIGGKVYSQVSITRSLRLIDLSAIPLRKLGISRKDLIECDGTEYADTRAWAQALHAQCRDAEGLIWTSRQADPARALVLFGDRVEDSVLNVVAPPTSLLLADSSVISEAITLAQRLDVLLTP
jgi:hypothetical protein